MDPDCGDGALAELARGSNVTESLEEPDGHRVVAPWAWLPGVSRTSEMPGAAWLFLQWATSRPVNLLASTDQWHGQEPYGWARSNRVFDREEFDRRGLKDSWIEAGDAMHAAVVGEKTARQALDDAAPAITEYARR
jgi:multiple sugar transport system substrate-binding protein